MFCSKDVFIKIGKLKATGMPVRIDFRIDTLRLIRLCKTPERKKEILESLAVIKQQVLKA